MSFSPMEVINQARRAVPVVDYALAAAAVAAACSLVVDYIGDGRSSLFIFGAMLVGMVLLILLGHLLQSQSNSVNTAAVVLTWAVVLFFVAFLGLTTMAAAFYWPPGIADLLGLSKRSAPLYYEGQPSFNCILDRNDDEQTICHSPMLSRMDVQLDDRYQQLKLNLPSDKFAPVHEAQVAWLASRRSCGTSVDCIKNLYTARLSQLGVALHNG